MLRSLVFVPRTAVRGLTLSARCSAAEGKLPTKREVDELFSDNSSQQRRNAFSKNRVEIVGGVAADPVLRTGRTDKPFTMINVITNHRSRTANGEFVDKNEFHSISVFGKQAEFVSKNIKKGNRVSIEGRLHYTGGDLNDKGERNPRQVHIHAVSIQPIARTSHQE